MRRSFKRIVLPMYLIRQADWTPFRVVGTSPEGQSWKFLPLFDSEPSAQTFQSVAANSSDRIEAVASWDKLDDVVQSAQRLGCQRVAWNPDRLHMKEMQHVAIEDVLHVIRKEGELN
jgi:hypothetical protein